MSAVTSPRIADSRASLPPGKRALLARTLRDERPAHGRSTRPPDREAAEATETAEAAVDELYRLIDEPAPRFLWAPSPPAAREVLRDDPRFGPPTVRWPAVPSRAGGWPVAARPATLASSLRERLGRRATLHPWNRIWFPGFGPPRSSAPAPRRWPGWTGLYAGR